MIAWVFPASVSLPYQLLDSSELCIFKEGKMDILLYPFIYSLSFLFLFITFQKKPLVLAMPYVTIDFFFKPSSFRVFVCLCECMEHYYRYSKRAKSVSHPLQLNLEMIVSHLTWMLGTKFRPPGRTGSSLSPWAISPAPYHSYEHTNLKISDVLQYCGYSN